MFKTILKLVAAAIAVFLVVAAMQPADYRYERSLIINASPATLFPHVNDLHAFNVWSPWAEIDPAAKVTYTGPRAGKGATMAWDGNEEVGQGSMSISDTKANAFIKYALLFEEPMKGEAESEITLTPEAGGTKVTWSMFGKNDFAGKAISLLVNCEKMIGDTYEKGLLNLKEKVKG